MFSNRSSRAQSFSSLHSESGENENPNSINMDPQIDDNDQLNEWINSPEYQFTTAHPIGKILINLVGDVHKKKGTLKNTMMTDLCTSFYNGIKLERTKMNNTHATTVAEVEKALMQKELNNHSINASILPPTNFSLNPVITSTQKLSEIVKIFPKPSRFSGHQGKGEISVIEFLNALTAAQNQCKLSESEFIDRILAASTGHAHDLILEWKVNGDNASTIYHGLLVNFDNRLPPDEAKRRLTTFTIYRDSNLAKAESELQLLIGRAATKLPPGESRIAYRDMEGCQTLIHALPPYSSLTANNLYQSYTTRLGRACTLHELLTGLNQYRGVIDRDIKANGAIRTGARNMRTQQRFAGANNNMSSYNNSKFSSFNNTIDFNSSKMPPLPHPMKNNTSTSYRPQRFVKYVPNNGGNYKNNYNAGNVSNNRNNRISPSSQNNQRNFKQRLTRPQQNSGRFNRRLNNNARNNNKSPNSSKCALCGNDHYTNSCENMRDDKGKIIKIIPTLGTCSNCPNHINPRLHHPDVVCPLEKVGFLISHIEVTHGLIIRKAHALSTLSL